MLIVIECSGRKDQEQIVSITVRILLADIVAFRELNARKANERNANFRRCSFANCSGKESTCKLEHDALPMLCYINMRYA